jgi:hypothetical protein
MVNLHRVLYGQFNFPGNPKSGQKKLEKSTLLTTYTNGCPKHEILLGKNYIIACLGYFTMITSNLGNNIFR